MKRILFFVLFIILLYVYIHNPILLALGERGAIKLIYPILLYFLVKWWGEFKRFFSREHNLFIAASVYIVLRSLMQAETETLYISIVQYIEQILMAGIFALALVKNGITYTEFIRSLLILCAIGSMISTACVVSPELNNYIKFSLVSTPVGSFLYENPFRGFGISEALTYSYGIVQGFILAVGLLYIKENKWLLLFVPFILLSIMVNARTGLVVAALGLVFYTLSNKAMPVLLSIAVTLGLLIYLLPILGGYLDSETVKWIDDFFKEFTVMFKEGEMEGTTAGTLSDTTNKWPPSILSWIIGRGYYLFLARPGMPHFDGGFFLHLNHGGLVYMFIWFKLLYYMSKRMKICVCNRYLILLMIATFFVAHFKGDFLSNTGGIRLFFLFYFYTVYYFEKNRSNA